MRYDVAVISEPTLQLRQIQLIQHRTTVGSGGVGLVVLWCREHSGSMGQHVLCTCVETSMITWCCRQTYKLHQKHGVSHRVSLFKKYMYGLWVKCESVTFTVITLVNCWIGCVGNYSLVSLFGWHGLIKIGTKSNRFHSFREHFNQVSRSPDGKFVGTGSDILNCWHWSVFWRNEI